MDKREATKRKIKALLAKTTENGATEQEAIIALEKAQKLMLENFVSEHELSDPYLLEKCVFKKVDIIKSRYDLSVFYGVLSELFDCEHYFSKYQVTFFGFEEDTELCAYFYNFIIQSLFNEKTKYMKSKEYKALKNFTHGKTLIASFIRGFLMGISRKMKTMYEERQRTVANKEMGLMVLSKLNKVKDQFDAANIKTRTISPRNGNYEAEAFYNGLDKGKNTPLTQGIDNYKKESTLTLAQ